MLWREIGNCRGQIPAPQIALAAADRVIQPVEHRQQRHQPFAVRGRYLRLHQLWYGDLQLSLLLLQEFHGFGQVPGLFRRQGVGFELRFAQLMDFLFQLGQAIAPGFGSRVGLDTFFYPLK